MQALGLITPSRLRPRCTRRRASAESRACLPHAIGLRVVLPALSLSVWSWGRLGSEPLKLAARRISSEASLEAMQGSANCCSVHKPSSVSCTQVAIACRKTCSCTKTQQTPCGQKSLPQRPAASRQPLAPKLLHHSTLNLAKAIERHEPCANSHNCSNCWASQRMPVRTTVRSLEMLKAPP